MSAEQTIAQAPWWVFYLPDAQTAAICIVGGAVWTQVWKLHRKESTGSKPKDHISVLASIVLTFVIAVPMFWTETKDIAQTLAKSVMIASASPVAWGVLVGVVRRYFPWLASVFGEERRYSRDPSREVWSDERREKALFGDTDEWSQDQINRAKQKGNSKDG